MFPSECTPSRRNFLKTAVGVTAGLSSLVVLPEPAWSADTDSNLNVIGPKKGYSPQIGTLVSMMTWMRTVALRAVKGMSQKDLDYLLDEKANTIKLHVSLLSFCAVLDAPTKQCQC
jgi:hypothetical protein